MSGALGRKGKGAEERLRPSLEATAQCSRSCRGWRASPSPGGWQLEEPPPLPQQRPRPTPGWALTQAGHGEHPGGCGGGDTVGEHGLQYVVGEGHGDDSQAGGVHDEDCAPEQQEAETSEDSSGRRRCGVGLHPGSWDPRAGTVLEAGFGPRRQLSVETAFSTVKSKCCPGAGVKNPRGTNHLPLYLFLICFH